MTTVPFASFLSSSRAAKIVRSQLIEPLLYLVAERFHRVQVRTDRCFRVGAAHEFLAHPLQKYGHRELLSLQPTLLVQTSATLFRPPPQRLRCVLSMFSSLRVKVPAQPDGGEGLEMMQGLPLRGGV